MREGAVSGHRSSVWTGTDTLQFKYCFKRMEVRFIEELNALIGPGNWKLSSKGNSEIYSVFKISLSFVVCARH